MAENYLRTKHITADVESQQPSAAESPAQPLSYNPIMEDSNLSTPNVTADVEDQQLSSEESPAQPIQSQSVDMKAIEEAIASLKNGARLKVSDQKENGIIFASVEHFNRAVNSKHVQELIESVKSVRSFLHAIQVISATEYFEFYPDRELVCGDNKVITKDSSEVKRTLVNLDGQHRKAAYEALKEKNFGSLASTLEVEYIDLKGSTPDQWMVETNALSRNWTSKDRREHIIAKNPEVETNISLASEWQNQYGMGERAAYAILNLADDYKKSDQVKYMKEPSELPMSLKGTDEQRKRGKKILHAFEVCFRSTPKMLKNMAAISLAIDIYKGAPDDKKVEIVETITLFFTTLDQSIAESANAVSGVADKKKVLEAEWKRMKKQFSRPLSVQALEEQATQAEEEWKTLQKEKAAKKAEAEMKAAEKKVAKEKKAQEKANKQSANAKAVTTDKAAAN